nr:arylsulfatase [Spelaeicoccus albus]
MVVLDDLGFASLGCYGSEIATPNLDALAAGGVQFTNFHATALCSPTRASLLTGRNSHAVGMAYLSHVDDGFPGYRGAIGHDSATLAEVLVDAGYNTWAVGKWHLAPMDQTTVAGPFDQWPLGRGFEHYYGFLEALSDHFHPELFRDNQSVEPPATPEQGYHLTTDLVDNTVQYLRDQTSVAPQTPFFSYLALGATHTPFHAPREFVERYRGRYDDGWDVIRERRYRRQIELGVIPPRTDLPPRNDDVTAWDSLSADERAASARFQEVYAGFLEHTDHEIGRLLAELEVLGRRKDTIVVVVADNGASQEGGPHGVLNTTHYENGHFPEAAEVVARMDEIDGVSTDVNYPLGWAQAANTPLKRYKQNTHAGGIRTAMIVDVPDRLGLALKPGSKRHQFQHVTDIVPTILDLAGVTAPVERAGLRLRPIQGQSMRPVLADSALPSPARTQYFETDGNRAVWKDGWKAVAFHRRGTDFAADKWELYHLDDDVSEAHDLAGSEPERLAELVAAWWEEARANDVLPLDDRGFAERANVKFRPHSPRDRTRWDYYNGMQHIGTGSAPPLPGRSFIISAVIDRPVGTEDGVLIAHGSRNSGYAFLVKDGHLVYDLNHYNRHTLVRSTSTLPTGTCRVAVRFDHDDAGTGGLAVLMIDDEPVGQMRLAETFEYFIAFQGLDVGGDRLSPVHQGDEGEFPFAGRLEVVTIELLGDDLRPVRAVRGVT